MTYETVSEEENWSQYFKKTRDEILDWVNSWMNSNIGSRIKVYGIEITAVLAVAGRSALEWKKHEIFVIGEASGPVLDLHDKDDKDFMVEITSSGLLEEDAEIESMTLYGSSIGREESLSLILPGI
jgi:hypothetical protein